MIWVRREGSRVVLRSAWALMYALFLGAFALIGFSVLTDPSTQGVTRAVYLLGGIVCLGFAVRALFRRVIVESGHVVCVGWWGRRRLEVASAEPVTVDERLFLSVWAPWVRMLDGSDVVLLELAGFARSELVPNRRVARACQTIAGAAGGAGSP